ncbi:MAG: PrsW family intramembrane metalloprotease [Firmicutes bacterium]|nr:PrsW family intramembrane metalloprotease [Bacillota bacterium]
MDSNLLMLLAVLPGILIIIYVYRKDKVEKEPWRLIGKLVFFGMLSCIPAAFMESFIDGLMPSWPQGSLAYALSMAFVSAALCEELFKYLFLRIGSWNNPNFGYRFDGIVYGVSVAVGFAILENILYVSQGDLTVALMRGVLAVPLHAFCGVFMGVFFGAAKKAQIEGRGSGKLTFLALFVPMMIHGTYDTMAFMGDSVATVLLLAFVLAMYIVSIRCIRRYSMDDASSAFYPDMDAFPGQGGYTSYGAGQGGGFDAGQNAGFGRGSGGYVYGPRGTQTSGQRPHPGQVSDGKIVLICPHCRRGLRVPVGAGRIRITCPHCGREFNEIT